MSSFDPPNHPPPNSSHDRHGKITYGRFPRATGATGHGSGRAVRPSGGWPRLKFLLQSIVRALHRVISGLTIGRSLAVIGGVGLLLMPVFYGVRVQLESYLRTLGEQTQAEQTDNQIRQSLLSRMESFQASSRLHTEFPNLAHNPDALVIPVRLPKPVKLSLAEQIWQFWAGPPPEQRPAILSPAASALSSNQY